MKLFGKDVNAQTSSKPTTDALSYDHEVNLSRMTTYFAAIQLDIQSVHATMQHILTKSQGLFDRIMPIDHAVWSNEFQAIWPDLVAYKIFLTLERSDQHLLSSMGHWHDLIKQIYVPPLANKILSLFGNFTTDKGRIGLLGGPHAVTSLMNDRDFVHVIDNESFHCRLKEFLTNSSHVYSTIVDHNGTMYATPKWPGAAQAFPQVFAALPGVEQCLFRFNAGNRQITP
jgi:hypothetical protein